MRLAGLDVYAYNHILMQSAHLSNFPNVKRRILLYLFI